MDTLPLAIVFPAVVGTLNAPGDHLAKGQGTGTVGTLILDAGDRPRLVPKQYPTAIKKFKCKGGAGP